jgi:hypothetical protein
MSIPYNRYIRFVCRVLEMPVPDVMIRTGGRFEDIQGNLIFNRSFCGHPEKCAFCPEESVTIYMDLDRRNGTDIYEELAQALRNIWHVRQDGTCSSEDAAAFSNIIHDVCFGRSARSAQSVDADLLNQMRQTYPGRYISDCFYRTH